MTVDAGTYPTVHRDGKTGFAPQGFCLKTPRFVAQLKRIRLAMREFDLTLEQVWPAMEVLAVRKEKQLQDELRRQELVNLALQSLAAERQQQEEERLRVLDYNMQRRQKRANMHVTTRELWGAKRRCVPLPSA